MHKLSTDAYFDSAHFLADYFGKCENIHGHRWKVTVTISAESLQEDGSEKDMVMDFGKFKTMVRDVVSSLDHTFLYQEGTLSEASVKALEQDGFSLTKLPFRTTAENLAKHIYAKLVEEGMCPVEVEVDETPNNRAIYTP